MKKLVLLVVMALFVVSCTNQTVESENYENQFKTAIDKNKSPSVGNKKAGEEEDYN